MTIDEALSIMKALADGRDPVSHEVFAQEHVLQRAEVARALGVAVSALEGIANKELRRKHLPANAGKAWTAEDDITLEQEFDSGRPLRTLAEKYGRSMSSIRARLIKLGKLSEEDAWSGV